MKKGMLLCLLLAATAAQAQSFRLGVKAGANATKIDGTNYKDAFKLGYHAGLFSEIDFNKAWGIQPEVFISQSNARTTSISGSLAPDTDVKLDYLSVPILLRINLSKVFTLNLGPQFSILLNENTEAKDVFKKGDFGMLGGLNINLKYFRIYGRYNIGLNNINQLSNSNEWQSQQIQAGIGLKF
jgi:hypothetical protein